MTLEFLFSIISSWSSFKFSVVLLTTNLWVSYSSGNSSVKAKIIYTLSAVFQLSFRLIFCLYLLFLCLSLLQHYVLELPNIFTFSSLLLLFRCYFFCFVIFWNHICYREKMTKTWNVGWQLNYILKRKKKKEQISNWEKRE